MNVPLNGRPFWKMTGSGNDFVFFDNREGMHEDLVTPPRIAAICDRRRGVGADGIVLLSRVPGFAFDMRYYNRDGSLAEMCGNAALCSARLASQLGIVGEGDFTFQTPSGPVTARLTTVGPALDMNPMTEEQPDFPTGRHPGETRVGYARVGVPHLVVLCDDVGAVDVQRRGRELRRLATLRDGANANFVARDASGAWTMRTYERGVEEETLACGTGAVAVVGLLHAWGLTDGPTAVRTRSGRDLVADIAREGHPPRLAGEGRIVFTGTLADLAVD